MTETNDGTKTPGVSSSVVPNTKPNERVEIRRTISPYDLTSSDNPGSVISQPLLKGWNYDEWSTNMRVSLSARKKFGFVDGTIPKPSEESGDLKDWWTNNALVVSWIKLTIDPPLRTSISHRDVACDLWEAIKKRFSVKNGQRVQRLKVELVTYRQRGSTIEEYYGKMMSLWTSLADHRQAKNCGCPLGYDLEKEREEDRLHEFLMGIDESVYGAVKSNLLSRDPLPSLDEAYSILIQDEDSKKAARAFDDRNETMAFAVQNSSRSLTMSREERQRLLCSSCGRNGHLAENCFRTLGYPDWWGDRPRNKNTPGRGDGNSTSRGTSASRAPSTNQAPPARANAVTTSDRLGFSGLNDEQWKSLVEFLDQRKKPSTDRLTGTFFLSSWIVDTGATNHMTGSLDYLTDPHDMAPMSVKLPDG